MEELGSPSSAQPPTMTIDGADIDSALAKSKVLSRREVLKRRLRRVNQLIRLYRAYYWALVEEVKVKHKEYYWTYGKSPFMEDHKNNHTEGTAPSAENASNCNGNDKDVVRCAFSGCKSKAMALTRYCHNHILSDSKQKLYRGCVAVAKNLPTGPSICNKPVLRSTVPPACPSHSQLGERCLIRALRRAGCAISTHRKPNLKYRTVLAESVHQIRKRRKDALKATIPKAETE
ncbi:INO80 complex subunit D-like [Senna tora]|uniref:INO80 complex subunit D-like n=1 Tax=Senna tora TaxID=362788 RepID=A0A834TKQ3_9FABA|nr:INO80 complex subunit D-like [Senna tora]